MKNIKPGQSRTPEMVLSQWSGYDVVIFLCLYARFQWVRSLQDMCQSIINSLFNWRIQKSKFRSSL